MMARVPSCTQDAEPRVVELLVQLAYLHQMTKSLIVAPDGISRSPRVAMATAGQSGSS